MLNTGIREILLKVRDEARGSGIDARFLLHHENSHLMRIGNNSVSLNTSEELYRLDVVVREGTRQGSQTYLGMIDDIQVVRDVLKSAVDKARLAPPRDYEPLTDRVEENVDEEDQYDEALENLDPSFKEGAYGDIFARLGGKYNYSGSWSSGSTELYVITTAGDKEAYHKGTDQLFSVVLKHPGTGWELSGRQTGWRVSDFDADKTVTELERLLKVFEGADGRMVEPGTYTVIFGAAAVAEIVEMAVWTGLLGRGWEEKRGWTAGKNPGDRILGENVSLVDDPVNPDTFMFGFDYCGRRRRIFPLVGDGELINLMYDSATAAKYGKKPTGHDINSLSLVMDTGFGGEDPLKAVGTMGRVLFIPDLHYVNIPSESAGIFTGSSRFNAVLVEDGEMVSPIFSTRVTDSFVHILGGIVELSSKSESVNMSNTYGRRSPVAMSVPSYAVCAEVKITDSADSF